MEAGSCQAADLLALLAEDNWGPHSKRDVSSCEALPCSVLVSTGHQRTGRHRPELLILQLTSVWPSQPLPLERVVFSFFLRCALEI